MCNFFLSFGFLVLLCFIIHNCIFVYIEIYSIKWRERKFYFVTREAKNRVQFFFWFVAVEARSKCWANSSATHHSQNKRENNLAATPWTRERESERQRERENDKISATQRRPNLSRVRVRFERKINSWLAFCSGESWSNEHATKILLDKHTLFALFFGPRPYRNQ